MELWMPTKCLPQRPIKSWLASVLLNTLLWQLRLLIWLKVCASTYAAGINSCFAMAREGGRSC
eukprot:4893502-Amphidinium_carterae.1